jgi:predicted Holliday junction resolvase-like endonuclease
LQKVVAAKEDSKENSSPKVPAKKADSKGQESKKSSPPVDDKVKQYERGMRKFQAERDAAAKELNELKGHWSGLEQAFQESGIEGVINLIAGDKDAYKKQVESELAKREAYAKATPSQRQIMEEAAAKEAALKRAEQLEKKFKDLETSVNAKTVEAEQKALKSVVDPTFEKYRFSGKLGDADVEHHYDRALWTTVMDNLNELPEEKITQEAIDSEFRKVSSTFRKAINTQADQKVKKTIETKKAHAQESAATKAMSGMSTNASVDDFRKNIRGGNITDAFRQLMSGKIRLS